MSRSSLLTTFVLSHKCAQFNQNLLDRTRIRLSSIKGRLRLKPILNKLDLLAHTLRGYSSNFCCLKSPRNFILALCSCDFEVPTEHPSILAISSCSCPSMS